MQKISIHNEEKVKELLENNWEKTFRYSQIENAIYKNFITDFDEMTTLSKNVRELLKENCFFDSLTLDQEISSDNEQTTKMLWKTSTWEFIESVIMRHLSWRVTLCVSCQAGCPMACSFCATWKLGLQKNLTAYEIIEQIFYAAKMINSEWARLRNIVFMWMWEPFLNYNVVKEVIQFASHQKKFDLWNRRITVSTCWIVPWIIKFTEDFPQTSLAVSLHAPNDEIRKKIMPVDHTWPLEKLMEALDAYTKKTNKRIFNDKLSKWSYKTCSRTMKTFGVKTCSCKLHSLQSLRMNSFWLIFSNSKIYNWKISKYFETLLNSLNYQSNYVRRYRCGLLTISKQKKTRILNFFLFFSLLFLEKYIIN